MKTTIEQIKLLSAGVQNIVQQYGLEQELSNLNTLIEKAEKKQINLLVCGEFKRGKSSFINAFLNENICPEAEGIATSVVSIISYGKTPQVIRHYGKVHEVVDNQEQSDVEYQTEEIGLSDIAKFADGTASEIQNTIMLDIKIPNERLKEGLTIIDTPGVGSLDPRHLFLTLYALPKADIIYFITDAGEPMQNTELNFYQSRIASTGKLNRILVNKADTKMRKELDEIINDIKVKINDDSVEVLPVSAKAWKEYSADRSNNRFKMISHLDEINDSICKDLNSCENYLSEAVRKRYVNILENVSKIIESRKSEIANAKDIEEKKVQYQQQIAEIKQLRDDVANPNSGLRRNISNIITDSQKKVLSKFSQDSILLSTDKLDRILQTDQAKSPKGEEFVQQEVNNAITKLSETLDKDINTSIEEVVELIGKDIDVVDGTFNGRINEAITPVRHTFSEKAVSTIRQSLPGMGVATLSGLAVSLIAPAIALPIGIVAGIAYVAKTIFDNSKQEKLNNIRRQITPRIQIAMNELRQYVQNRYDEFNKVLQHILDDTAAQMAKQMQDIFELFKQCENVEQKRQAEIKKMEEQNSFIGNQIKQAQIFNTNPFVAK